MADLPDVAEAVDAAGGEVEGEHVLLARNVSAEGRSRAFVGGASVPVSQLADGGGAAGRRARPVRPAPACSSRVHSATPWTRSVASTTTRLLADYRTLYADLRETERELGGGGGERARAGPRGRPAAVRAGRDRGGRSGGRARTLSLAEEEQRLGHADTLRTAAESAREALSSDEGSPDALAAVAAARTLLDGVREHDAAAAELADRVAEITYLLSDVAADVASYASGLETDPARLAAVSERRAALTALTRKYGETAAEVLAWAEASAGRLAELDDTDDRITRLREQRDDLRARLGPAAAALSEARTATRRPALGRADRRARPAGDAACRARGGGAADPDRRRAGDAGDRTLRFGSSGVDEVEFLLAANTGVRAAAAGARARRAASCRG